MSIRLLDCTLRDGGYYNNWDFSEDLVSDYLKSMAAIDVDFVEIGMRTLKNTGFSGPFAFTTETFLSTVDIPSALENKLGIMINAKELIEHPDGLIAALSELIIPRRASKITLVRIACHLKEFEAALPAALWLKSYGYRVGFNLMQVTEAPLKEITRLCTIASHYSPDVLYFADSLGAMDSEQVSSVMAAIREGWQGDIGIHTHDNMGKAMQNTLRAIADGACWVDGTITGMGRGAGNAQIENLAIEIPKADGTSRDLTRLLGCIRKHFEPLKAQYKWGTNPYYHLAGKYSIHPTYIQEMLTDSRYTEEDLLTVIGRLAETEGSRYSAARLDASRHFYAPFKEGSWSSADTIKGRDILILGPGESALRHRTALTQFVDSHQPFVMALNLADGLAELKIDARVACHPMRILADAEEYIARRSALITPYGMLPLDIQDKLGPITVFDYGLQVSDGRFEAHDQWALLPNTLALGYALAIAAASKANNIFLAGFDGYSADDPRRAEIDQLFAMFDSHADQEVIAITPTRFEIPMQSVYGMVSNA